MKSPGSSLMEYALPIALVTVICIGSVYILGENIRQSMNQSLGLTTSSRSTSNPPPLSEPSLISENSTPPLDHVDSATLSTTTVKGNTVCLNGSICISAPQISEGTAETDGALGGQTTHKIASILDQIEAELKKISPTDPQLMTLVQKLANQGHNLGNYQSNMARLCGSGCQGSKERKMTDTYSNYQNQINFFTKYQEELKTYLATNETPLQNYPAVQSVIDQAANSIQTIAKGVTWDENREKAGNKAKVTHTNANTICSTGNGGSDCIQ